MRRKAGRGTLRRHHEKVTGFYSISSGSWLHVLQYRDQLDHDPQRPAAPGITGISMTVEHFTGINYALIYYAITILILVVTYLTLGKRDASNIIILSLLYPMVLWVLSFIDVQIIFEEKLIAWVRSASSTGWDRHSLPDRVLLRRRRHSGQDPEKTILRATEFKKIYYFEEALILLFMTLAFSLDQLAYAFAGQLIYVNSMNYVVFNLGPKLYDVQMIGKNMEKIEDFVINTIHKSVTIYHDAVGGYSGEPKIQMSCVCNSREYVRLREFIRNGSFDCFIKVIPLVQ